MSEMRPGLRGTVIALALAGGLLPLGLHWFFIGRVPGRTPEEAQELLGKPDSRALLVDVREAREHAAGHIEGSRHWPLGEVLALASPERLPEDLRGKDLLFICESGLRSAAAVRKLRDLGISSAWNVKGGLQAWTASVGKPCALSFCRLRAVSGETRELPSKDMSLFEQWTAVITAFGVKPFYVLLSLAIVLVLWRQAAPDLSALRWGFIFFFLGENLCTVNFIAAAGRSLLLENLHSYGMVLCFGLAAFALFEGLDRRILRLSDPGARCAALSLCRGCSKASPDFPCGLQRTFVFIIPAAAFVTLLPFTARPEGVSYNVRILGSFYNYSHSILNQIYEVRFLPAVAVALCAASFLALKLLRRDEILWSKVLFSAGLGAAGFSFFRLILFGIFQEDLHWFEVWEELTELVFVSGAAFLLWIFRGGLLRKESVEHPDLSPTG